MKIYILFILSIISIDLSKLENDQNVFFGSYWVNDK